MNYLHTITPPLLHRDLKSLNVLLKNEVTSESSEILAKITDFGISRGIE